MFSRTGSAGFRLKQLDRCPARIPCVYDTHHGLTRTGIRVEWSVPRRLYACDDHTAGPDGHLDYFNKLWLQCLGFIMYDAPKWRCKFVDREVERIVAK